MENILIFLIGLILGYGIASFLLAKKKFIVRTNEKNEVVIEPVGRPKKKVEFIGEPTKKEVEEAERPTPLQGFLNTFKKPASKEEEEEE